MAKEEWTSVMSAIIRKLRERQKLFEVLSDEEFYSSSYGETRREKISLLQDRNGLLQAFAFLRYAR